MNRLEELGINLSLSIAGFFGSLLVIGKEGIKDVRTTILAMFGGVASANYLTPVVCDLVGVVKINHQFSIAFILGFMGLRGVEKIIIKLLKKNDNI